MNSLTKTTAILALPMLLLAQAGQAAITDAVIDAPLGATFFSVGGNLGNYDADGDGLADDLDIVNVSFTLDDTNWVTIDSDTEGFNSFIYVFGYNEGTGEYDQLYTNDNASRRETDSYLESEFAAGKYMVALGARGFSAADALLGYDADRYYSDINFVNTSEVSGSWKLTVIAEPLSTEVPVPAALPLFLSALFGLSAVARKRKVKV